MYLTECVQVIVKPGTYVVRPGIGSNQLDQLCGVYIEGLQDETIIIDVSHVGVSCKSGGKVDVSIIAENTDKILILFSTVF